MPIHLLGIRHHGVGSAKNVLSRLKAIQPDIIFVEGPPEITDALKLIGQKELKPPVAIMLYDQNNPKSAIFYPFTTFSPEWVAAKFANKNNIPIRSLDLSAATSLHIKENAPDFFNTDNTNSKIQKDPLSYLSDLAGFENSEKWWDFSFENNPTHFANAHFDAVFDAMSALRTNNISSILDNENSYREANMRQLIRIAQNEMYLNIAVVCGAWHAPSLVDLDNTYKSDTKLLKSLPKSKVKVACTWIPWTNDRLSMQSGYGAGIASPGWYRHLWKNEEDIDIKWLSKVAKLFRKNKMDITAAHVIDTLKLSRNLADIRDKSEAGLEELNDAILSTMCMGDEIKLKLIEKELIIANKIGKVPDDIPKVPLQADFEQIIKSLRLGLTEANKQLDLDLRKENDLKKSVLFHRLEILQITWANRIDNRTKGTFKESWIIRWNPTMMIQLIDLSYLGNTIEAATNAVIIKRIKEANRTKELTDLINLMIPSELNSLIPNALIELENIAAVSYDITDLMESYYPLVDLSRYGNVRKSDLTILNTIVEHLFIKIYINLPNICYGLDEENAYKLFALISKVNDGIRLIDQPAFYENWYQTLQKINNQTQIHKAIQGCVCRLLFDAQQFTENEAANHFSFALSVNNEPTHVALWIDGFLYNSGMIIIYDSRLWNLLYKWVESLEYEIFIEQLPFLRRAFSKFEYTERKQIGQKAKSGLIQEKEHIYNEIDDFDNENANLMLKRILEIAIKSN